MNVHVLEEELVSNETNQKNKSNTNEHLFPHTILLLFENYKECS